MMHKAEMDGAYAPLEAAARKGQAAAKAAFAAAPDRFRAMHDERYDCSTWESWKDDDGDTWVGCREHGTELLRHWTTR